jgi:hypothetical protein
MTRRPLIALIAILLISAGVAVAKEHKHANLRAAHEHLKQAIVKITEAQKANEFDMGGHAAKAKTLIEEADRELEAAKETADHK